MTGDVTGSELAEVYQQSHMSVTGHNRCEQGTRAHTIGLRVGIKSRYAYRPCGAAREVLACSMIKIDEKINRVGNPEVPGPPAK